MIVENLHHLAIVVSDYEKSKDFYVNKLGFEVIREEHRQPQNDIKLEVQLGNCMIEIFGKKAPDPNHGKPTRCGVRMGNGKAAAQQRNGKFRAVPGNILQPRRNSSGVQRTELLLIMVKGYFFLVVLDLHLFSVSFYYLIFTAVPNRAAHP